MLLRLWEFKAKWPWRPTRLLLEFSPELSGLVFSLVDANGAEQDGFLQAHEVYNLKLPVDMVVLSVQYRTWQGNRRRRHCGNHEGLHVRGGFEGVGQPMEGCR